MEINYKVEGNQIFVELIGELDTPATEQIQPTIDQLLTMCDHNITIDCAKLSYIASSGLRQFLSLRKAVLKNNTTMSLINIGDAVMTVLKVSNFDRIFGLVS